MSPPIAPARVLLAGNPNAGKTTLFNGLTGARRRVGNYAGVTVERVEGRFLHQGREYRLLDLPGTYSLAATGLDERVAREEIVAAIDADDTIVVVADAGALERHLLLLWQLRLLGARAVLVLNMIDEAEAAGLRFDVDALRRALGVPVVCTEGRSGRGLAELREAIAEVVGKTAPSGAISDQPRDDSSAVEPRYPRLVPPLAREIEALCAEIAMAEARHGNATDAGTPALKPLGSAALKALAVALLEEQAAAEAELKRRFGADAEPLLEQVRQARAHGEHATGFPAAEALTQSHFAEIRALLAEVCQQGPAARSRTLTATLDGVLAHRVWGAVAFLAVMYGVFWFTFAVGEYPMAWLETALGALGDAVGSLWPDGSESLTRSLLVDGVIGGVGAVVAFLPNILLLFLALSFLEDTGYMARAAFLTDGLMSRFGLHGKSFIPMVTGVGCNIPAMMATRTLAEERDRLATLFVMPFISCGARQQIWLLLVPAFFAPAWNAPVMFGIYLSGIGMALAASLVLRRTVLKGEPTPFMMELPPYRLPTTRTVLWRMWDRAWAYLRQAGTLIMAVSIVLWALTTFPRLDHFAVDDDLAQGRAVIVAEAPQANGDVPPLAGEGAMAGAGAPRQLTEAEAQRERDAEALRHSIAGRVGAVIEPLFTPFGVDWRVGVAMVGTFAAKEVFVAQMGVIFAAEADEEHLEGLRDRLRRHYSPAAGLALMAFLLVATPCMATVAVMRRESGSWAWALGQFGFFTGFGWLLAVGVYNGARMLGWG